MMKYDKAVSPVIGTILLVAITVVLIAIIGAVVMSLANVEEGNKVGVNAQVDNTNPARAKVILYGGESVSDLVKLEMIDQNSPNGVYVELWSINDGKIDVGVPYTTKGDVAKPLQSIDVYDTRINVKGTFSDGRESILLVQSLTFYDVNVPYKNKHFDSMILALDSSDGTKFTKDLFQEYPPGSTITIPSTYTYPDGIRGYIYWNRNPNSPISHAEPPGIHYNIVIKTESYAIPEVAAYTKLEDNFESHKIRIRTFNSNNIGPWKVTVNFYKGPLIWVKGEITNEPYESFTWTIKVEDP